MMFLAISENQWDPPVENQVVTMSVLPAMVKSSISEHIKKIKKQTTQEINHLTMVTMVLFVFYVVFGQFGYQSWFAGSTI